MTNNKPLIEQMRAHVAYLWSLPKFHAIDLTGVTTTTIVGIKAGDPIPDSFWEDEE